MVKQFLGYAIPSALAMCIASLNTIIDGVFLGNGIGDAALGAVNIVMPITIVFFGLATMVSVGGGALISKNFGANEDEKGISIFRQVTYMLIIMSLCLSAICVIFAKPIVKIMGATENLLPLAAEYLKYYAMFCLPSLLGIAFNSFLRNDNKPKLAMVSTICGTISNIILNYIFIFKLGLGIKSAAIATGFGQIITLLIALPHFILKKGKLSFGKQNLEAGTIREVLKIGLPSFFAEAAFSVIIFVHNLVLVNTVGEIGISTYAIINYITTNIYLVLLGVTLGAQPLISYNYGANRPGRVRKAGVVMGCLILGYTAIMWTLIIVAPRFLIQIFSSDSALIADAVPALKLYFAAFIFMDLQYIGQTFFKSLNKKKHAIFFSLLRKVVIVVPLTYIFPYLFNMGSNGVFLAEPISNVIGGSMCFITMLCTILPELKRMENK